MIEPVAHFFFMLGVVIGAGLAVNLFGRGLHRAMNIIFPPIADWWRRR